MTPEIAGLGNCSCCSQEFASQQATSRRSSPQEAVGGTIADVQCWPVGRRRNRGDDVHKRADRALKLVQMGELSAGRLVLDGAQVADGNQATLKALTDKRRRPPVPRAPLSQFVLESQPEVFSLDEGLFVQSLRSSRRGAAAGPSGMTAVHQQPVLDTARYTSLFFQLATVLARAQAPAAAVEGVRMGRITALKKPNGGIREIVVGDILRRLVARTMAKQMAARVEAATAPFRCALTTKAGCESHPPKFDRSRRACNDRVYRWSGGVRPHISQRDVGRSCHSPR